MGKRNNILLISDNPEISRQLVSKIVLLREDDNVVVSDYDFAEDTYESYCPDVVLLNENLVRNKTTDMIKFLLSSNPKIIIILVASKCDPEFIMDCYDMGVSDFCMYDIKDYEIVVRLLNNVRLSSAKLQLKRYGNLLSDMDIIDGEYGFYTYKFRKEVFNNEVENRKLVDAMFVVMAPSNEYKKTLSSSKFCDAIKASVRNDDIVINARGAKYFLLLPGTGYEGTFNLLDRIKSNYAEDFVLKAGMSTIYNKSYVELEKEVLQALSEAMACDEDYVVVKSNIETLENWVDEDVKSQKEYKIFRQIFNKKMDKVISPVFYRLQKSCEDKLPDVKIEQYSDGKQCVFKLNSKKQNSQLKIMYPGFAKIVIYIMHEGLDSPENSEISIPLSKITQKELIAIIEKFVEEFKIAVK